MEIAVCLGSVLIIFIILVLGLTKRSAQVFNRKSHPNILQFQDKYTRNLAVYDFLSGDDED